MNRYYLLWKCQNHWAVVLKKRILAHPWHNMTSERKSDCCSIENCKEQSHHQNCCPFLAGIASYIILENNDNWRINCHLIWNFLMVFPRTQRKQNARFSLDDRNGDALQRYQSLIWKQPACEWSYCVELPFAHTHQHNAHKVTPAKEAERFQHKNHQI